jgi:hypothetical protein
LYIYIRIYVHTYYTYIIDTYILHTYGDIYMKQTASRRRERERERGREKERETYVKLKGGNSMDAPHLLHLSALVPRHLNLDQLCVM